jgi:hypothetical protein
MQWIKSVFAIYYNSLNDLTGHVWGERFKSKIIDDIRQMIATFKYIIDNPVKAGVVDNPRDYEYNGINFFKNNKNNILKPPVDYLKEILDCI